MQKNQKKKGKKYKNNMNGTGTNPQTTNYYGSVYITGTV
jgi:hypothetical protein